MEACRGRALEQVTKPVEGKAWPGLSRRELMAQVSRGLVPGEEQPWTVLVPGEVATEPLDVVEEVVWAPAQSEEAAMSRVPE